MAQTRELLGRVLGLLLLKKLDVKLQSNYAIVH